MSDISFNTACKELKIAQIAQLNQLFQLLHLAHIYGHCCYLVSRMLMSKNVNNDVSKDSPIQLRLKLISEILDWNRMLWDSDRELLHVSESPLYNLIIHVINHFLKQKS